MPPFLCYKEIRLVNILVGSLEKLMLDFLFKHKGGKYGSKCDVKKVLTSIEVSEIYTNLKHIYKFDEISQFRKTYLKDLIEKHHYLPYSYIKALEELSPAEILFGLEIKWGVNVPNSKNADATTLNRKEDVFDGENFTYTETSPLARNSVKNADWIKREGHEIKLINLAGLGNGNVSKAPGKFIDWLRQLLILPAGDIEKGIFATTIYLIPFQEREFGCAYLPKSTDVSSNLEDAELKAALGLSAKEQVQTFITFAQLAGHPVIYDVLPQTGRFAKIILANPNIARWFDIKELLEKIDKITDLVAKKLKATFDQEDVEIVKDIFKQDSIGELSEDYQKIYDEFEKEFKDLKKAYSNEMTLKENQVKIQKRVREIVAKIQEEKPDKQLKEEEISKQNDIIQELIKEGLWSAPGGAWCSAGVPVFDKMSDCGSYPIFSHYDFKGEDVSDFANLDCQTPFYFTYLENGEFNKTVIDFFVKYMESIRNDYNFDGFRIDHIDHVVDDISEKNGKPISYRVPRVVLTKLNTTIKEKIPYFASLAEYMLGGGHLKEYQEMKFDLLWGNDIIAQSEKTPEKIVEDNQNLEAYNLKHSKTGALSVLKTYNNQDGEFNVIDQYPGQLGEEGALFKWFKYKFLPGGKNAQRPVLYVDGDESFTRTGIEKVIGNEISMKRVNNDKFFAKFDAISRFAKSQQLVTEGEAQIIEQDDEGFVSWMISKEPLRTALLVVANYLAPTEKVSIEDEDGGSHSEIKEGEDVFDKKVYLPCDYKVVSEFIFDGTNFIEKEFSTQEDILTFDVLQPSEFKVFLLTK